MADENKSEVLQKVLDEINKVHDTGKENHGEIVALKAKADQLERDMAKVEEKAAAHLDLVKAALSESHGGPTGAADWLNETAKWIRGVHAIQKLHQEPTETFKNGAKVADVIKATTEFTTTTGATAGYLIPTLLRPGFVELKDIYGNLYPRVTKFNSPAGQSVTVNDQSGNPTALWQSAQNAALTQNDPNTHTYNDDTLVPKLLYVVEKMANELINNPSINFAAMAAVQAAKAVNRKLEYDMLAAASSPHAGVVAASTAQTTMASATFALTGAFLKECIADNAYAVDSTRNCLFLHPRDAITLALQAVGATELTGMLVWGDPRRGIPTTLLGYEVIIHPGCNNGSNNYMFLGDPANIILAEGPSYMIDFSDQVGFLNFQTAMRVGNHYDYIVKQTTEWHRAVVTA